MEISTWSKKFQEEGEATAEGVLRGAWTQTTKVVVRGPAEQQSQSTKSYISNRAGGKEAGATSFFLFFLVTGGGKKKRVYLRGEPKAWARKVGPCAKEGAKTDTQC